MKLILRTLFSLSMLFASTAPAAIEFDPPACKDLPVEPGETLVGITMPSNDVELSVRLAELGTFYDELTICSNRWDQVLPQFTPTSQQSELERYYGWGVFALALLLVLLLVTLAPKAWRKHVTVLGLLAMISLTWGLGTLALMLINQMQLPQQLIYQQVVSIEQNGVTDWYEVSGTRELDRELLRREVHPTSLAMMVTTEASDEVLETTGQQKIEDEKRMVEVVDQKGENQWVEGSELKLAESTIDPIGKTFVVHQPLNLREGAGVQYATIGHPLPRKMRVEVIGPVERDWWKVRLAQRTTEGWVSSLWLRAYKPITEPVTIPDSTSDSDNAEEVKEQEININSNTDATATEEPNHVQ